MSKPVQDFVASLSVLLEDYRLAQNDAITAYQQAQNAMLLGMADQLHDLAVALGEVVPEPPDPPDPPDPPPVTGRSFIGWNLPEGHWWMPSRPFRNQLAMNNIHFGRGDQQPPATFDKYGQLVSGKANARIITSSNRCQAGMYEIKHDGTGSVSVASFGVPSTGADVIIDFNLVGPTPNLRCVRAGDTGTSVCTDAFIARHRGSSCIRLMDARLTNKGIAANGNHYRVNRDGTSPIMEETITPAQAHAMATECSVDLWWNVHHLDTDNFIREYFSEFKALGGSYKILVEVSNELWNGAFAQGVYGDQQPGQRYQWLWRRTKEVMRIAREILGDRAKGVIAGQCFNFGVIQQTVTTPTEGLVDFVAMAPYFNYFESWSGGDAELLAFVKNYEITKCRPALLWNKQFAESKGMKLIAYENGSDFSEVAFPQHVSQFRRVNAMEGMADIYRDHLDWWKREIGTINCFYATLHDKGYGHWQEELLPPQPRGRVIQEAIKAGATA